ncbi:uncharacterized protein LOC131954274 [Physella acuta]|uniref:uncharacterized protein LOC131954274 n=1 Tax=Physella acuta TaxID=109671 RepID=UPI0027DADEED|nr:uncharacterized protein LOC131954274 [Physella acuta]XP_059173847.1 uncharacterized protein LOC131954274 [Physella acuta]
MASFDKAFSAINMDESGIEAQDLVSLLCRFEEATRPADDLSISSDKHFIKKQKMMLKARSAGNSPAITPPATPPPNITIKKVPHPKSFLSGVDNFKSAASNVVFPSVNNVELSASLLGKGKKTFKILKLPTPGASSARTQPCIQVILQNKTIQSLQKSSVVIKPEPLDCVQAVASPPQFKTLAGPLPASQSISIVSQPANTTSQVVSVTSQPVSTPHITSTNKQVIPTTGNSLFVPVVNIAVTTPVIQNNAQNPLPLNISIIKPEISPTCVKPSPAPVVSSESSDHDYCFFKTHWKDSANISMLKTKQDIKPLKIGTKLTEEASVPLEETTLPQDDVPTVEEVVVEESEIFIDANGNDAFPVNVPQTEEGSATVKFNSSSRGSTRKHSRRYRHHAETNNNKQRELSTSPIREDSGNFYDKIPSFYTALSIPTKPTKTSIFASATSAIGSTDHLDLLDKGEDTNESHYDKVPAHRRCFTNTTKDIERIPELLLDENIQFDLESDNSLSEPCNAALRSPYHRSRSVSRHSSRASCRSGSSSSNCSTCSTCSSLSYCSTCSSRSRSVSACSSRSTSSRYSRSRSPSPQRRRDRRFRSKRTRSRFTPSRSRSRSRSRYDRERSRSRTGHHSRQHSSAHMSEKKKAKEKERVKAMEERRIVYVGKIPNDYSKRQLYQRFQCFGEIKEVKLNFREHGDNYGFVTFAYACDAIAAKERGNNTQDAVKFDLCFGGRRRFCPDQYADLDGNQEIEEEYAPMPKRTDELDYAALLKQHSSQQRKK